MKNFFCILCLFLTFGGYTPGTFSQESFEEHPLALQEPVSREAFLNAGFFHNFPKEIMEECILPKLGRSGMPGIWASCKYLHAIAQHYSDETSGKYTFQELEEDSNGPNPSKISDSKTCWVFRGDPPKSKLVFMGQTEGIHIDFYCDYMRDLKLGEANFFHIAPYFIKSSSLLSLEKQCSPIKKFRLYLPLKDESLLNFFNEPPPEISEMKLDVLGMPYPKISSVKLNLLKWDPLIKTLALSVLWERFYKGEYEELTKLYLKNMFMENRIFLKLAKTFEKAPALEQLYLKDCHMGDENTAALAAALGKNSLIGYLNLRGNDIGDKGVSALAQTLKYTKAFGVTLLLENNKIGDVGALTLIENFRERLFLLSCLNLSNNQITDKGAFEIINADFTSDLHLSYNRISVQGALEIAKALQNTKKLRMFHFSLDGFSNADFKTFLNEFNSGSEWGYQAGAKLFLDTYKKSEKEGPFYLKDEKLVVITPEGETLLFDKKLYISPPAKFSINSPDCLTALFCNESFLQQQSLSIDLRQIRDEKAQTLEGKFPLSPILKQIEKMKNLQTLSLGLFGLNDTIIKQIIEALKTLNSLKTLSLTIPDEMLSTSSQQSEDLAKDLLKNFDSGNYKTTLSIEKKYSPSYGLWK